MMLLLAVTTWAVAWAPRGAGRKGPSNGINFYEKGTAPLLSKDGHLYILTWRNCAVGANETNQFIDNEVWKCTVDVTYAYALAEDYSRSGLANSVHKQLNFENGWVLSMVAGKIGRVGTPLRREYVSQSGHNKKNEMPGY